MPWTEEPGGLQSMGSQGVGQDRVTWHARTHKKSTVFFPFYRIKTEAGELNRLPKNYTVNERLTWV